MLPSASYRLYIRSSPPPTDTDTHTNTNTRTHTHTCTQTYTRTNKPSLYSCVRYFVLCSHISFPLACLSIFPIRFWDISTFSLGLIAESLFEREACSFHWNVIKYGGPVFPHADTQQPYRGTERHRFPPVVLGSDGSWDRSSPCCPSLRLPYDQHNRFVFFNVYFPHFRK